MGLSRLWEREPTPTPFPTPAELIQLALRTIRNETLCEEERIAREEQRIADDKRRLEEAQLHPLKINFEDEMFTRASSPRISTQHLMTWGAITNNEENDHVVINEVGSLLDEHGDISFYIGICGSPYSRFWNVDIGHGFTYGRMHVILGTTSCHAVRLEKMLIDTYISDENCQNKRKGGGGRGPPKTLAFVYVCTDHAFVGHGRSVGKCARHS